MSKEVIKVGDSVVVKPGVKDPDTGAAIGGWQGRVEVIREGPDGETLVEIHWDSVTLRNMPASVIESCELEGLDWGVLGLGIKDVERTEPRDTVKEAQQAQEELSHQYEWVYLGEGGKRIQAVLQGVSRDEMSQYRAWYKHLEEHLSLPFEAEVSEYQDRGPPRAGDKVKVFDLSDYEDLYGVLVDIKHKHGLYVFPLCDLEVLDKTSPNYQLVDDYAVWFANR